MSTYRYMTKNTGKRGSTTTIYLPKEWGIKPGTKLNILFWDAGTSIPDDPYKLSFTAKSMNSIGAVGIYIPKTYLGPVIDKGTISMCVITEEDDGDA